jgi:phage protein D
LALEKIAKQTLDFYAPRFEVEINNQKLIANISKQILNVRVEEKIDEGVSFAFTMNDEFDLTTLKFKWLDHQLFKEGNRVTIKMGYANQLFPMVVGEITSLESSFFSGETTTLTVGGQDLSYDYIKRVSPERTFVDKTYGDIARTIASEAGLLPVVDDPGKFEPFVRKDGNKSYFAFLEDLEGQSDREFSMDGQTMYFIKPRDDKKEIVTLELGKDIISFSPRMNTTGLVTEVEVRGHNPRDPSTPIIGRATAGSERTQEPGGRTGSQIAEERHGPVRKVITDVIANSVEHANAIAQSVLNELSDNLITGDGECIGIPLIRPGVNIRLERMGEKFSGKYYVKETTHTIDNSGYRTRFKAKKNAVVKRKAI